MTVKELDEALDSYKKSEKDKIRAEKGRWRRFWLWIRYFFVITWKWLFMTLKDWRSWLIFLGCVAITGSSVWVMGILYLIFRWEWALAVATGSLFFWNCVPCTPFIAINLFLTILVKGVVEKCRNRE